MAHHQKLIDPHLKWNRHIPIALWNIGTSLFRFEISNALDFNIKILTPETFICDYDVAETAKTEGKSIPIQGWILIKSKQLNTST